MKILITKPINTIAMKILEKAGHSVTTWDKAETLSYELLKSVSKDFDALITMLSDRIDSSFLEENSHLKVITNYAVGYNNIDTQTATRLKIAIGNTPDVLTQATADLAFALLLNISRKITTSASDAKNGLWKGWEPLGYIGQNLRAKTLGIYGAGRIGQEFASLCKKAFDMEIIYCARSSKKEFENSLGATKVEFSQLLSASDIISIHCDLNEDTKEVFDIESFRKMKKTSLLINTARGQIIKQDDLLRAVRDKLIYSAGLDVTEPEPLPKDHPLYNESDILITPHIGSATTEARYKMAEIVAENILCGFEQRKLAGDVNKLFQ
ncbi:D-glycerate dehydrogenase [Halobacteriovorax sp. HLS]|uniref:2-hydroxyacid dehydrogenase n=1 Tax=Halobacteriovorax sp. HLS TaxID=2234000 RepID=UPI000FD6C448|nr:D-glycerate dehydrogenase [Halobacteriovorax sp. HLS]